MFSALKPTEADVIRHLVAQRRQPYSYDAVGATKTTPPQGFNSDRHRVRLGFGEATFRAGCEAIRQWRMFPTEMAELYWPDREIEEGTIVDVLFKAGPFWSLNPARIVYTVDQFENGIHRFGFAYGTLPDHLESGEESFIIEWDTRDDSVWYELHAFSKARHLIAWWGYPYVRYCQAKFRRLSGQSMQLATSQLLSIFAEDDSQCFSPVPS